MRIPREEEEEIKVVGNEMIKYFNGPKWFSFSLSIPCKKKKKPRFT
jgi:hypothetical protein